MNISPVSFGRTIKVNAPLNVAHRMAELVNQSKSVQDKNEKTSQQALKTIFYDSNLGSAQALEINGETYIVTGETSRFVSDVKLDAAIYITSAKKEYGEDETFEKIKESEIKRCNEYLSLIVKHSNESLSISTKYENNNSVSDSIQVADRIKIKSINLML